MKHFNEFGRLFKNKTVAMVIFLASTVGAGAWMIHTNLIAQFLNF